MAGISVWPAVLLLLLILCGRHLCLASCSIAVADFVWQASLIGQLDGLGLLAPGHCYVEMGAGKGELVSCC